MENKLWFRDKRYGWGWYPITWQGWVCVLTFVLIVLAVAYLMSVTQDPRYLAIIFVALVVFITIGYKKGEKPRWRWGGK